MDPYLAWGLALFGVAVLLGAIELFVPSGGIIAVTAGLTAIAGIIAMFMHDTVWGLTALLGAVVFTPVAVIGGLRIWSTTKIGRTMLGEHQQAEIDARKQQEQERLEAMRALVGSEGVAVTDLHPIGVVRLDGKRYEASSELGIIDTGDRVVVTHADGFIMRVRRADSP